MEFTKTELSTKVGPVLRAASRNEVIITSHGKPSYVIVSIEQWEEMLQIIEDAKSDADTPDLADDTTT